MTSARGPIDRVILWGFMGSGKTVVGARLARELRWSFVDLDREIERREQRRISEIFAQDGEEHFRRIEVGVSRELLPRRRTVFSCGGGWVTSPEVFSLIPEGSLTVWLRTSLERVMQRVSRDHTSTVRPLLATADPASTARRLLADREPLYRRAQLVIDTDHGSVSATARLIESHVYGTPSETNSATLKNEHDAEG